MDWDLLFGFVNAERSVSWSITLRDSWSDSLRTRSFRRPPVLRDDQEVQVLS